MRGKSPLIASNLVALCDSPAHHKAAKGLGLASIFLSYSREDVAAAKALARCLERAGHLVWWDRHIHGGSEYADEIETALGEADAIVVLWSTAASHSAWVRDEAAEGRDSGRLVPLLLDSSPPPLGFRQLQSISIAGWSGRGNPPEFAAIKAAIERTSGRPHPPAASPSAPAPRRGLIVASIAALALLLAVAAGYFLLRGGPAKAEPTIAVLPFADLSPGRDKAFLAEGVAEAILTVLAKEPGIKVIGRSSASQLEEAGKAAPEMRKAMGITHVLEGSAQSIGNQLRMSVRLVDAEDGSQIWAEEYDRRLDNIFTVQDEISRAVATRLRGSIGRAPAPMTKATSADAYTLYLAARAKMRDRRISSLREATVLARQVLAADPNYAPGHALYAELIEHMSFDNYGTLPPERAKQLAMPHARKAIALEPDSSEGYAALGMILDGEPAIAPLRKAIRLDPARAELRLWLAGAYHSVGKNEEAFREVRAGSQMEPLWPSVIATEAGILAASERFGEAEAVIRQFERRGGSAARAAKMRADIAGWYRGDYSEAIRLIRQAVKADPETPLANPSLAWMYGALGLTDQAKARAKDLPLYSRLYIAGDFAAVADAGRSDGKSMWSKPDPDIAIDAMAIERDWKSIVELYEAYPQSLRLVCGDLRNWTVQMGINLASALKAQGLEAEAGKFVNCVAGNLKRTGAGPVRSPYLGSNGLRMMWAQLRAIEGRSDEAFALLSRAVEGGARTRLGAGISHLPAFDGLRSDPRYARLDARFNQLMAQEAAEVRRLPAD